MDRVVCLSEVVEIAAKMAGMFSGDLMKRTVDAAVAATGSKGKQPGIEEVKLVYEQQYLDRAISLHLRTLRMRDQARVHGLKTTGL